jgi:uncharacterized membrane protein YebE (DUF533 family)
MFDADDLLRGVLTGVMGGRRKRSRKALRYLTGRGGGMLSNPNTLLTVAGVAWGIFETLQVQNTAGASSLAPSPAAATAAPPLPNIPGAPEVPADAVRMIRLAIAAASADGTLSDDDRVRIVEQARLAGAEHLVERELQNRRPVAEIVAGVADPAQRATLYVLAFGIIRADESVSGAERIFLAQLANQLGLDPATVSKLESDAAARIDSQE